MGKRKTIAELIADQELASDKLALIAADVETCPTVLAELASSTDLQVRAAVGFNPRTPGRVLRKLLNYHIEGGVDQETCCHILLNPSLPIGAVEDLVARSPFARVRAEARQELSRRKQRERKHK